MRRYRAPSVEFVGYDGGATLALLLATRIPQTTRVITIAGILDTNAYVQNNRGTSFKKSLNPADEKNVQNIRTSALRQIPKALADKTEFYHLRGGIDYEKLSFRHRMMMKLLYEQVKKQPVGEQDADTRAMIETYGQKVSFVDTECLEDIVKKLED